ncbi:MULTISPECIES: hypothetical protein [unclassified Streptomyces]|uniref:hypothetical protein n=1 Tax=unclassified Streptomyces TaxID=2593676 RepID=UPI0022B63844|nr:MULTISPECIES: hypothetical protein [unclassified Streptomyces]MCZ7417473.1 hypothetical protein [Streptomyces sp. WMMC897]MCZ7432699.1 hypothetical protein [Streptomyces sp. WMMC1477]
MPREPSAVQDREALAEIELYGELIIAAAAEPDERLSDDRIDEVLGTGRRNAPEPDAPADAECRED